MVEREIQKIKNKNMENNINIIEEITKNKNRIYLFSLKLLKYDKQSAEDLTQDTMQKAISYVPELKNTDNISGWLHAIARNIFINDYRKKKKRPTYFVGDSFESTITNNIIDNYDSIQETESNIGFIMAQLKRVNPKYEQCIQLMLEGKKIEEISSILNIPTGTVKSRIFMGRKEMKENIKPILEELDFEIRD